MFPNIKADLDELNKIISESYDDIRPLGKTFVFNYKTGQHELVDGNMVECSSDEAVAQWIEKVLRTELDKFEIYVEDETDEFGISIYRHIGKKTLNIGYIMSELKREITEQLLRHRYINYIEDYSAQLESRNRKLHITFTAVLITGSFIKKEVELNGL